VVISLLEKEEEYYKRKGVYCVRFWCRVMLQVKEQGESLVWPCILGMLYAPMRNRRGSILTPTPQELNGSYTSLSLLRSRHEIPPLLKERYSPR
jgi:hypothetical protein